ncbi:MAG: hypothetical protein JWN44_5148, partial [Myxococcales bacterium]|nr:hypothetical protein [Myxococcales bacterium]
MRIGAPGSLRFSEDASLPLPGIAPSTVLNVAIAILARNLMIACAMADTRATDSAQAGHRCAQCGGATPLRTPHVQIAGGVVRSFCSAQCAAGVAPLARAV